MGGDPMTIQFQCSRCGKLHDGVPPEPDRPRDEVARAKWFQLHDQYMALPQGAEKDKMGERVDRASMAYLSKLPRTYWALPPTITTSGGAFGGQPRVFECTPRCSG